ncbi:MAG TPA: sensor domain-containing diguanylate cyclase [Terriglobia bacterium]|nr:sensor domain-containing diguanylate cyclase [Terriglobia bacterium]
MSETIFILGSNESQCAELRDILKERVGDAIVTTSVGDLIPRADDAIIVTGEEQRTGVLYRRLLDQLAHQAQRAEVLGELMRLFSSALSLEDILEKVVAKSTKVLGDTAFIVLNENAKLRLEAAFSTDRDRLTRLLVTAVNVTPQTAVGELLGEVLEAGNPLVVPNLNQTQALPELRPLVEKYGFMSLVATPIRLKDKIFGAFISISSGTKAMGTPELTPAAELADFTAMVVENARLFAELQRTATIDPLTGLYNKRLFHEVLGRETARTHRYSTPLSLLMIDVDSFKRVNDNFGHPVGDRVLAHIGQILERTVRNTDFVFRYGGDEFSVILPGTNVEGAVRAAEKILQKVQSNPLPQTAGHPGLVSVSIGVSEYRKGTPTETLISEADQALYASKRSTKNTFRVYPVTE